jgi:nucleoid DNA-binding protein
MNQKALLQAISDKSLDEVNNLYLNEKTIKAVLSHLESVICDELKQGSDLVVPGIGKFSVVVRAAKQGRNPRTGESILIPERKVVSFKPSKAIRDVFTV